MAFVPYLHWLSDSDTDKFEFQLLYRTRKVDESTNLDVNTHEGSSAVWVGPLREITCVIRCSPIRNHECPGYNGHICTNEPYRHCRWNCPYKNSHICPRDNFLHIYAPDDSKQIIDYSPDWRSKYGLLRKQKEDDVKDDKKQEKQDDDDVDYVAED